AGAVLAAARRVLSAERGADRTSRAAPGRVLMHALTRRDWLSMTTLPAAAWLAAPAFAKGQDGPANRLRQGFGAREAGRDGQEERIRAIIDTFEKQGFHRTATDVDRASADWLCREVEQAGLAPVRESFSIDRVDLVDIA